MTDKSYKVGYKKPPKHSRFKKGQSGNKSGRPKGATNKVTEEGIYSTIEDEASRMVSIREGEKTLTMPMVRVVVRSLMTQATKNTRAASIVLEQMKIIEQKQLSKLDKQKRAEATEVDKLMNSMNLEQLQALRKALNGVKEQYPAPPRPTRWAIKKREEEQD